MSNLDNILTEIDCYNSRANDLLDLAIEILDTLETYKQDFNNFKEFSQLRTLTHTALEQSDEIEKLAKKALQNEQGARYGKKRSRKSNTVSNN
jgi:hypothetical protein